MINRRDFIKTIAGGAAAGAFLPLDRLAAFPLSPEGAGSPLAVVTGPDPAALVTRAVELVGGMNTFVSSGDVVFVKPNISWDRPPEQGATTNPAVVETVVRLVLEAGAKKVIVADNTCNDARRCYVHSGIKEAAEKAGADVPFMEKRKFVETNIGGKAVRKWDVYREVLDADKIINVPVAKHHGLSGVTLSMKNLMGLVGGARNRMHQRLDTSIVDLLAFFRPSLTILDAVRILVEHGPQGGTIKDARKLDTVAACVDPVKIDAWGITILDEAHGGRPPADFAFIRDAEERGLGTSDFRAGAFIEQTLDG